MLSGLAIRIFNSRAPLKLCHLGRAPALPVGYRCARVTHSALHPGLSSRSTRRASAKALARSLFLRAGKAFKRELFL